MFSRFKRLLNLICLNRTLDFQTQTLSSANFSISLDYITVHPRLLISWLFCSLLLSFSCLLHALNSLPYPTPTCTAIYQQILGILLLKYIPNQATSHYLHCYHFSSSVSVFSKSNSIPKLSLCFCSSFPLPSILHSSDKSNIDRSD